MKNNDEGVVQWIYSINYYAKTRECIAYPLESMEYVKKGDYTLEMQQDGNLVLYVYILIILMSL